MKLTTNTFTRKNKVLGPAAGVFFVVSEMDFYSILVFSKVSKPRFCQNTQKIFACGGLFRVFTIRNAEIFKSTTTTTIPADPILKYRCPNAGIKPCDSFMAALSLRDHLSFILTNLYITISMF